MHLAAAGVAIASVIAQYVSAGLIIANLLRREDECNLSVRKIRLHKDAAKSVLLIGLPTGIQNAILPLPICLCRWASIPLIRLWYPATRRQLMRIRLFSIS